MKIKSMSLAWVTVKNLGATKKFLTETLGLEVSSDAQEWGWLEVKAQDKGVLLGVAQENPQQSEKAGSNAVVTMTVDNIVAAKAELEQKGVRFTDEIMEVPGHVKIVTFVDLDGNKFQLVEELHTK